MGLPKFQLPTKEVLLSDGSAVEVRGLTRYEASKLYELKDAGKFQEIDPYLLACGTGVDIKETEAWIKETPFSEVETLISAIIDLSGISPDAEKKE